MEENEPVSRTDSLSETSSPNSRKNTFNVDELLFAILHWLSLHGFSSNMTNVIAGESYLAKHTISTMIRLWMQAGSNATQVRPPYLIMDRNSNHLGNCLNKTVQSNEQLLPSETGGYSGNKNETLPTITAPENPSPSVSLSYNATKKASKHYRKQLTSTERPRKDPPRASKLMSLEEAIQELSRLSNNVLQLGEIPTL